MMISGVKFTFNRRMVPLDTRTDSRLKIGPVTLMLFFETCQTRQNIDELP